MKVSCVFSLELHHRGNSNKYKQYAAFDIKKENYLNSPKSDAMGCFQGIQKRVRKTRIKLAISVRATVGLCTLSLLISFSVLLLC